MSNNKIKSGNGFLIYDQIRLIRRLFNKVSYNFLLSLILFITVLFTCSVRVQVATDYDRTWTATTTTYIVPVTGWYRLTCAGGQGGICNSECNSAFIADEGYGAVISAEFFLEKDQVLNVVAGNAGTYNSTPQVHPEDNKSRTRYGGTGGTSSVSVNGTLLLSAGGGSGGAMRCWNKDDGWGDSYSTGSDATYTYYNSSVEYRNVEKSLPVKQQITSNGMVIGGNGRCNVSHYTINNKTGQWSWWEGIKSNDCWWYSVSSSIISRSTKPGYVTLELLNWVAIFAQNKPSIATSEVTGITPDLSVIPGTIAYLTENNYKLRGWIWQNWNTEPDGLGTTYADQQEVIDLVPSGSSIIMYAQWKPIKYNIKFNGNNNWNPDATLPDIPDVEYDHWVTLPENPFTRELSDPGHAEDTPYEFIGWSTNPDTDTPDFTDGETIRNLTDVDGDTVTLYAIWRKNLKLTFNLNGSTTSYTDATYKGRIQPIVLQAYVYNSNTHYNFNILNGKTIKIKNVQSEQVNTIDAYNNFDANGINQIYRRYNRDTGETFRLLGWSLNPNATEPDEGLCVYKEDHRVLYKIKNNTTLYAVWEPVLQLELNLNRVLGQLGDNLPEPYTNHALAMALVKTNTVAIRIYPGEAARYTLDVNGDADVLRINFDPLITDIYDTEGAWTDILNPNPSTAENIVDGISIYQKHGLNRQPEVQSGSHIERNFYVPAYLGTIRSKPESAGITQYYIHFYSRNSNSYYWKNIMGNVYGEEAEAIAYIYLPTKDVPDTSEGAPGSLPGSSTTKSPVQRETKTVIKEN